MENEKNTECPDCDISYDQKFAVAQEHTEEDHGNTQNKSLSSYRIRLSWPLVIMFLISAFSAYRLTFRDGVEYFIWCSLIIGLFYAIFSSIIWGLLRWPRNHDIALLFASFGKMCIWATIVITFFIYPISDTVKYRAIFNAYCKHELYEIGLAMSQYHLAHGSPVPCYAMDKKGKPLHSWRVLLLPYLEERKLYSKLRLDEPWNSPHNLAVFRSHPKAARHFCCPAVESDQNDNHPTDTSYIMLPVDGLKYQFEDSDEGKVDILIGEVTGSGIHWAEPRDRPVKLGGSSSDHVDEVKVESDHGMANLLLDNGTVRAVQSGKILLPSPNSKHTSPDINESQKHK